MVKEDDFFGVEYISEQPLPHHMLPNSALSKAEKNRKVEKDGTAFIDSTFFPGLDEDFENNDNENKQSFSDENQSDDFFTKNFYRKGFTIFIFIF